MTKREIYFWLRGIFDAVGDNGNLTKTQRSMILDTLDNESKGWTLTTTENPWITGIPVATDFPTNYHYESVDHTGLSL